MEVPGRLASPRVSKPRGHAIVTRNGIRAPAIDEARVAFVGATPQSASEFLNAFDSNHIGVSVEVRTDATLTEVELESGIKAAHYAVMADPDVLDASTSYDTLAGQIKTEVRLVDTASDSALNRLKTAASAGLTGATRADILDSITVSVARSTLTALGVDEDASNHYGGEAISTCTTGFGTKTGDGKRGISTAGHCQNSQFDDGDSLTFEDEHYGDMVTSNGTQGLVLTLMISTQAAIRTVKCTDAI